MNGRVLSTLIAGCLALGVACKKQAPPPAAPPPAPPPAAPAPEPVPEPVVEMVKNFQRVYFDFDSDTLAGESRSALDANVKIMQEHPDIRIELQGHADERGTTDYNLALGQRRANAVRGYMTSQGVAGSRLKLVSYGEERPLDGRATESAWSKNRRAEFVIEWGEADNVRGTAQ